MTKAVCTSVNMAGYSIAQNVPLEQPSPILSLSKIFLGNIVGIVRFIFVLASFADILLDKTN